MSAIYPYRWAGQFSDVNSILISKAEWGGALINISDEAVKFGLESCRKHGGEFPPSIPTFLCYCEDFPQVKLNSLEYKEEEKIITPLQKIKNKLFSRLICDLASHRISFDEKPRKFEIIENLSDNDLTDYDKGKLSYEKIMQYDMNIGDAK